MPASPAQIPKEWPKCSSCGSEILVVGGDYAACVGCESIVPVSQVRTDIVSFAQTRISLKMNGTENISVFTRQTFEWGSTQAETASRLFQRMVHQDVYLKLRRTIKQGETFVPQCVMNYHSGDMRFVTLPIKTPIHDIIARKHAAMHDISSVFWIGSEIGDFSFSDAMLAPVPESGVLIMHTHFYGAPTLVMTTNFSFRGGKLKFSRPDFHHAPIASWAGQAVCWQVMPLVPNRIAPRFFGGRLFESGLCINAVVSEDMDGIEPLCVMAIRSEWGAEFKVTKIPATKVKAGIREVQSRLEAMDKRLAERKVIPAEVLNIQRSSDEDPRATVWKIKEFASSTKNSR